MYQISNNVVPQNKRKEINEKIQFMIQNDSCSKYGITKQNIYEMYSGSGGLHGLDFNDYDSFHSFTEAKKVIELGEFFTSHQLSKFLVDCLKIDQFQLVADLTAGSGNFINWLPNHQNVYANELNVNNYKVMKYLYPEINAIQGDIREYNSSVKFDYVLGNPPFNLKLYINRTEYLSQLYYCIKAHELLKPCGILALIVPVSFLSDDFSDGGMISQMNDMYNFIYQVELPSDSFKSTGVDKFRTKIMFFSKKSEHVTYNKPYNTNLSMLPQISKINSESIYIKYIAPVIEQKEKIKHKLLFEQLQNNKKTITVI